MTDDQPVPDAQLLANIKRDLTSLTTLADRTKDQWAEEDCVYRFWHQSFKVYAIQDLTLRVVDALEALAPEHCGLDERFRQIVEEGTGKTFKYEHNQRWLDETRPMLEAFWHADYMLRMAVRHGQELDQAPNLLPSGWAALLTPRRRGSHQQRQRHVPRRMPALSKTNQRRPLPRRHDLASGVFTAWNRQPSGHRRITSLMFSASCATAAS
jgi:hypothetical protein